MQCKTEHAHPSTGYCKRVAEFISILASDASLLYCNSSCEALHHCKRYADWPGEAQHRAPHIRYPKGTRIAATANLVARASKRIAVGVTRCKVVLAELQTDITTLRLFACSNDPIEKVQQVDQASVDLEDAIVTAYDESTACVSTVCGMQDGYAFSNAEGYIVAEEEAICAAVQWKTVGYSGVQTSSGYCQPQAGLPAQPLSHVATPQSPLTSVCATTTAVAEAQKLASIYINASCQTDEGGYACGSADSYVQETRTAAAATVA